MINRVSQKEALLFELILWQPEQISKKNFSFRGRVNFGISYFDFHAVYQMLRALLMKNGQK